MTFGCGAVEGHRLRSYRRVMLGEESSSFFDCSLLCSVSLSYRLAFPSGTHHPPVLLLFLLQDIVGAIENIFIPSTTVWNGEAALVHHVSRFVSLAARKRASRLFPRLQRVRFGLFPFMK